MVLMLAISAPSSAHIVCGIGERTDKRNSPFLLQRKEMLVVFKQYKGFGSDIPGNLAMSVRVNIFSQTLRLAIFIGIVE